MYRSHADLARTDAAAFDRADQAAIFKNLEMSQKRWKRHVVLFKKLAYAGLAVDQLFDDSAAGWVCQGGKSGR